jgi:dTDP-4-amino-4,6-dideoxygalactose transaminase
MTHDSTLKKERIWLSPPHMSGKELEFIHEAFDSNWISPAGPNIIAFENELSHYLDGNHVAALSSGTAAIHLALIILSVQRDDEVICSTFTFSGSCNPIVYQGAKPVFVDSESETWNMDPDLLKLAIKDRINKTGKKPKAIIVVHLYGMPAKMNEIMAIAMEYNIPVIEDAAEALGSTYKGKKCGTFGDFGILSFNGNKIITTSGGGGLVSKDTKWIEKARFLATQARDPAPHYQHSEIGYNYRLSNICAGIGRGQLSVLDERVNQRRLIFREYQEKLAQNKVQFLSEPEGFYSNRWLTTALLKNGRNEEVRFALEEENIESRPLWKPMHLQPVFKDCPAFITGVSEALFSSGICLPSGSSLSVESHDRIVVSVKKCLEKN